MTDLLESIKGFKLSEEVFTIKKGERTLVFLPGDDKNVFYIDGLAQELWNSMTEHKQQIEQVLLEFIQQNPEVSVEEVSKFITDLKSFGFLITGPDNL